MKTLKAITAALIFSAALVGCGGGASGDYAAYQKINDWGVQESVTFESEAEFQEFVDDACGQEIDVLSDRISGNSADQRAFYLVLRAACGEDTADKAWFGADVSDWDRENPPSDEYEAILDLDAG